MLYDIHEFLYPPFELVKIKINVLFLTIILIYILTFSDMARLL